MASPRGFEPLLSP